MLRPLRHLLWAGLIGLVGEAAAAPCDPLVGEFMMDGRREEVRLRIERSDGRYFARLTDGRGQWGAERESLEEVPLDELKGLVRDAECGLGGGGGVFVKTAVGGAYLADNIAQKGHEVGYALSGVLMVIPQGFSISVVDLFPVTDQSGPAEPRVEPSPERAVAGVMQCPGDRAPDLTQAAYDALPAYMKDNIQRRSEEDQIGEICGQELVESMRSYYSNDYYVEGNSSRLKTLGRKLDAGLVPRDGKGVTQWWELGEVVLADHREVKRGQDPLAEVSSAVFLHYIVPHLSQQSLQSRPMRMRALRPIVVTLAGRSDIYSRAALVQMRTVGLPVDALLADRRRG